MVKTYAVNCNDAWLNTDGDDISGSYVKYEDYAELERRLLAAEAQEPDGLKRAVEFYEQAQADTTSQQFESLAFKSVVADKNGNLPCPFCGGRCDPNGWMGSYDDGVPMCGPECEDCGATANSIEEWNRRTTELAGKAVVPEGWIKCSERMPGPQEWVIVFAKWANQQVLCWDDVSSRWTDFEDQSYFHDMFSHWMPLAAAPQPESE